MLGFVRKRCTIIFKGTCSRSMLDSKSTISKKLSGLKHIIQFIVRLWTSFQSCCARYFTKCDELSIEAIFSDFCEFRYSAIDSISDKTESQKTYLKSEVMEFITGLGRFFDTMYPLQLLYKYDDPLPADSSRPISSCSILHLLRFLSRLQQNIQEILQNNDCANTLKPLFQMFLNWLE